MDECLIQDVLTLIMRSVKVDENGVLYLVIDY